MRQINIDKIQNLVLLFIVIAPITMAFYASYIFNPVNRGNFWLYLLLVIAEMITILNLSALWVTILLDILQPLHHKRDITYDKKWMDKEKLSIDVLIPVYNEPLTIVKKTIKNVVGLEYPHKTFVLDDGASTEVKKIASELGAFYIARPHHAKGYAKAGNLNYGLQHAKGEFFAIFDADHAPKKSFLLELLPFFENENVSFVQTPQHYTNTDNFIASGTAQAQEIFYKFVQPAKNSYNASFCVGTNMLYRRSSIDKIGGIALLDHSEDIWTSILLHQKGYESVFYNKVLAEGRAPETIHSFFRQQNRWARGGFSLFFMRNPIFIKELNFDQRLQYFFSNIHYFTGFSVLVYILLPIIFLLSGEHPMNTVQSGEWPIHFIPYFLTIYLLPYFLLGKLRLSTISTAYASFAPYIEALLSVVAKSRYNWVATETKIRSFDVTMRYIWPHVLLILLCFLSVFVGWYNVRDTITTTVSTFWVLINAYILFAFLRNGLFRKEVHE